jgi:peptide/nickel transport system permease protein
VTIAEASPLPRGSVRDPQHMSERKRARRENLRLLIHRPSFAIGLVVVAFWSFCAIFGSKIAPHDPYDFRTDFYLGPRGSFPFGTDSTGRDVFSRVLVGSRDVLIVAPIAAVIGVVIGVIL